jgi:flagellar biosynthesis/type III secretory pathway M-ring protein FliF/YscJ
MNNKQKAKKMGIDYTNMTPEELKIAIKNKEAENAGSVIPPEAPTDPTPPETPSEAPTDTSSENIKETTKNEEIDSNVAVVMNGKFEVRRYTVEDHGENFKELAEEFASKKDYQVKLIRE